MKLQAKQRLMANHEIQPNQIKYGNNQGAHNTVSVELRRMGNIGNLISVGIPGKIQPAMMGEKFKDEAFEYAAGLANASNPESFVQEHRRKIQERTQKFMSNQLG